MKNEVQLKFTKSKDQIMNIFFQASQVEDFIRLRMLLGVTNQL